MKRQTRSEARERVFSVIFQIGENIDDCEFIIDNMLEEYPESADNIRYIRQSVSGVLENKDEIKEIIETAISGKRAYDRLSKAVRVILSLAVFEMKYVEDVPEKVAVNEAVELAKKYAEEEAPAFVNGVLSGVISK